ncbi:3-dehydroquinate synthase [Frankliniella fusca]|uniref:3-dehydroquinate synthase n=1 Tax=Frankliniella fusca TaxID=407009 RepID=A0AAE1LS14_9NEOP|nr:3-dehydroquinate synthase [Frankliniella fusca]
MGEQCVRVSGAGMGAPCMCMGVHSSAPAPVCWRARRRGGEESARMSWSPNPRPVLLSPRRRVPIGVNAPFSASPRPRHRCPAGRHRCHEFPAEHLQAEGGSRSGRGPRRASLSIASPLLSGAGAEMEPPQGEVATTSPATPSEQHQQSRDAPQRTADDNNRGCQKGHDDEQGAPCGEDAQDALRTGPGPPTRGHVSPAAGTQDVSPRTFSEVVRASPSLAHRPGEVTSSAGTEARDQGDQDEDDGDDARRLVQCLRGALLDTEHRDADVEVILVDQPQGAEEPFGGYVDGDKAEDGVHATLRSPPRILVFDEDSKRHNASSASSTSLESAVSDLPGLSEAQPDSDHLQDAVVVTAHRDRRFLRPLKRIVRIYLRRRVAPSEAMGNLQGSEGKLGRSSASGGKSPGKQRKGLAKKSPFRPGKGPAPAPPPTQPPRGQGQAQAPEPDDEEDSTAVLALPGRAGGSGGGGGGGHSGTAAAAAAAHGPAAAVTAGHSAGTDVCSAGSGSADSGGTHSSLSDPFLTPHAALTPDAGSHYSDADNDDEEDVIGAELDAQEEEEDDDDDLLSDARTLTPASARHSSRLQDKTSDDDATLTDCDDRSDWERTPTRTPARTPVHAHGLYGQQQEQQVQTVKASLQNLSTAESVGLSRDDLTHSMAGSMAGSLAGSVSSVSGLSGSVGSVSGAVSSLGGNSLMSGSMSGSRTSFTVTRHRKVDLAQARIGKAEDSGAAEARGKQL